MFYAKTSAITAVVYDDEIVYQTAIENGAIPMSEDEYSAFARTASPISLPLTQQAQALLDYTTGTRGQFSRAQVAGMLPNDSRLAPWQSYVQALRAIANGTDISSTALPTQPAYIEGT